MPRSEEHTSELQSQSNLVCRLLTDSARTEIYALSLHDALPIYFLVIHPGECIDCALCVPACPVNAIFTEDDLPEGQREFLQLNAELAAIWPNIKVRKDAPADAEIGRAHV